MAYTLYSGYDTITLILIFTALITDILDGWIARAYHAETPIGTILDPLADKVFIAVMFSTLALWIAGTVIGREIFLILGGIALLKNRQMTLPPTWLSKINTFFQCMVGASLLMRWPLWPSLSLMLIGSTLSTIIYGFQGWKLIRSKRMTL